MRLFDRLPRRNPQPRRVPAHAKGIAPALLAAPEDPGAADDFATAVTRAFAPPQERLARTALLQEHHNWYGLGTTMPDNRAPENECEPAVPETPAVTEALAPLRAALAEVDPEPPVADILQRTLDGLRNLPDAGRPQPGAWLVHVMPDGRQVRYPLGLAPVYKGATVTRDGRPVAGSYLGTSGTGYLLLEVTSAAWCEDHLTAVAAMQDALVAAGEAAEGGEAA